MKFILFIAGLIGLAWYLFFRSDKSSNTGIWQARYGGKKVSGTRLFFTKIKGVTKTNEGGSDRQKLVRQLRQGDMLHLVPDPDNHFDPNAIKIVDNDFNQYGFVPAKHAASLQDEIEQGYNLFAQVTDVTGGSAGKSFGVNIAIYKADKS